MTLPPKIQDWPTEWRELWVERAGIMEFEGKWSRETAEWMAERDIRKIAAKEK